MAVLIQREPGLRSDLEQPRGLLLGLQLTTDLGFRIASAARAAHTPWKRALRFDLHTLQRYQYSRNANGDNIAIMALHTDGSR